MTQMSTDEVLQLIINVADEVITPRFRALSDQHVDQKAPGDFVTIADREAEELITAGLLARNPDALIVGEEASYANPKLMTGLGQAELAYTVDPVDGTTNFVKGSPRYAVMVAEVRRGETTRGGSGSPRPDGPMSPSVAGVSTTANRCGAGAQPAARHDHPAVVAALRLQGRLTPTLHTNYCAGFDYSQLFAGEVDYSPTATRGRGTTCPVR